MYSSVSASRAVQENLFLCQALQHVDDFSLNRRLASLHLPAVEIRPVVSNGEFEMAHAGESLRVQGQRVQGRQKWNPGSSVLLNSETLDFVTLDYSTCITARCAQSGCRASPPPRPVGTAGSLRAHGC